MSSVEQLITPQYVYSNIVEHLRSQLSVKTLNSSELSNLRITEVEIAAFGSRYHFEVERTVTEDVESSIIELSTPRKGKAQTVTKTIVGYLEETLEPGANHPTFNFQARVI
ncbi:hypothetical protein DEEACLCL_00080 [Salmonella phage CRW-SP2]|nr:hypothetical protein DEEACLCL_00080 [Salmonella phage CRW-SP2]